MKYDKEDSMIDADKVIEEIEARTEKKLDDEQSKAVFDGFVTMMNMLWSNQEKQKNLIKSDL